MKKTLKIQKKSSKSRPTVPKTSSVPKISVPAFKLTPLNDRVIIKERKDSAEITTASGIILPASVQDDKGSKRGVVVAIGAGHYDDGILVPPSVNVGDAVLFSWGDTIKVDGDEYAIVRESDIIAIVN